MVRQLGVTLLPMLIHATELDLDQSLFWVRVTVFSDLFLELISNHMTGQVTLDSVSKIREWGQRHCLNTPAELTMAPYRHCEGDVSDA